MLSIKLISSLVQTDKESSSNICSASQVFTAGVEYTTTVNGVCGTLQVQFQNTATGPDVGKVSITFLIVKFPM